MALSECPSCGGHVLSFGEYVRYFAIKHLFATPVLRPCGSCGTTLELARSRWLTRWLPYYAIPLLLVSFWLFVKLLVNLDDNSAGFLSVVLLAVSNFTVHFFGYKSANWRDPEKESRKN